MITVRITIIYPVSVTVIIPVNRTVEIIFNYIIIILSGIQNIEQVAVTPCPVVSIKRVLPLHIQQIIKVYLIDGLVLCVG